MTVKHNSSSTEVSLLRVICDLKAWRSHRVSFLHLRTGFTSFFSIPTTSFFFHARSRYHALRPSERTLPGARSLRALGLSSLTGFVFTRPSDAELRRAPLPPTLLRHTWSHSCHCWPQDWFIPLLFVGLSGQMCGVVNTGEGHIVGAESRLCPCPRREAFHG